MRPLPLAFGLALAAFLAIRRHRLGRVELLGGALVVAACLAVGLGIVEVPDFEKLLEDLGTALGPYTYALVGALAFLETGAFIGLLAPGETAVLVGGVVAGQGQIDPIVLIAIVWTCAVAGDLTSYFIGRRLGRDFMLAHGARLKITEERLQQVEGFFERRGGATILIGRFIGLVRALAPFIAGSARMPLRKFVPYDILGAGLWATLFVTLGYVFWRSIGTVTTYVGQGLLLFGVIVGLVVAGLYVRRLLHHPAERERARAWIDAQAARPGVAPVLRALSPAWHRVGRPVVHRLLGPGRFAYERLTPGGLGLELTTLLALLAVGGFAYFLLSSALSDPSPGVWGDDRAFSLARSLYAEPAERILAVLTEVGSLPFTGLVTAATALWAISRRRATEGIALATGLALTWAAVALLKEAEGRLRPAGGFVETMNLSFPSGHAAYGVALVACAVVMVRAGSSLAVRFAAVTVAFALMALVALSRVYLRAHYLSDVLAGLAVGAAVFSLVGIVAVVVAFLRQNPSE